MKVIYLHLRELDLLVDQLIVTLLEGAGSSIESWVKPCPFLDPETEVHREGIIESLFLLPNN